ncbi:biotin--[acetyl-CoA-carboxylase] ligase [Salinisphaera sp. Q1T1-3]|uniref:biotin--[acetyl-CoA-carboxylase] ligase n=1 Tax=Salinisphaera sp. Q1T1-3 TaxID=2321229 RepID=UPI000E754927|nr:biotin--[acetyl-CoA-carboxylase] ligase [Salinisphaera sp. Q1T1-3]RJS94047.1 biotin--[acetyl-CoA-carboxylase] ligase [Salinisphaera sp. Q1T1-3]
MPLTDRIEMPDRLLAELADGEWHSGPALARALGVTRSAISARIGRLRATGLDVFSVSGRGYRLAAPLDLLDGEQVRHELGPRAVGLLDQLLIMQHTDSTNTRLAAYDDGATRACLAEQQSAGRGRAGRAWVSPMASNLYLSVGHDLMAAGAPLGALSLAIGVSVAETLTDLGVRGMALKWPNDLWVGQAKVGGILIEARSEASGIARVVAGLGLNLSMPATASSPIDQPWTRLADHVTRMPARSTIAGRCLDAVLRALDTFAAAGFAPFARQWPCFDLTVDQPVRIIDGRHERFGIARGLNDDASLIVEIDGRREAVYSGDVSLRLA